MKSRHSRRGPATFTLLLLSSAFSGCLFVSPEAAPGFGGPGFSNPTEDDYRDLTRAITWANGARSQLRELKVEADVGRRLTDYGIAGVGLATVGAAAFKATRDVIVGLALGTTGLATLNYVTDTVFETQTIGDGLSAIDCVQDTATGMASLSPKLPKQQMAPMGGGSEETSLNAAAQNLANVLNGLPPISAPVVEGGLAPAGIAGLPGQPRLAGLPAPSAQHMAINAALSSKVLDLAAQQQNAALESQRAIQQTANSAPAYLIDGTLKVRRAVLSTLDSHLPKTSDISNFIDSEKKKLQETGKKAKTAKDLADKTDSVAASAQLVNAAAPNQLTAAVSTMAATVQSQSSQAAANADEKIDMLEALSGEIQNCKQITDSLGGTSGK